MQSRMLPYQYALVSFPARRNCLNSATISSSSTPEKAAVRRVRAIVRIPAKSWLQIPAAIAAARTVVIKVKPPLYEMEEELSCLLSLV